MRIDLEQAGNADQWRKRAKRLRALAKITHRAADRAELSELANQWEAMARLAERRLRQRPNAAR